MNLKNFHILFITIASLVLFGVGFWGVLQGGLFYLGLGFLCMVSGAALICYGMRFYAKMKTLTALALIIWVPRAASACSVCFGDANSLQAKGLFWAVTALLLFLAIILVPMVAFFLFLRRADKRESIVHA